MKKGCIFLMAFLIGSTVVLNSCLSLLGMGGVSGTTGVQPRYTQDWDIGEFTDRWGEAIGEKFLTYKKNIRGVFSNRLGNNNSPLVVNEFVFSKDYISFELLENGSEYTLIHQGSTVNVIMRTGSLGEKTFTGRTSTSSSRTVIVNLNDDIKNMFLSEEEINFRITISNRSMGESYYQFSFKPNNFKAAFESMNSEKN